MPLPAMNISAPSARKHLPKSKPKRKSTRLACAKTTNGSVAARNHVLPKHFPDRNWRSKRTRKRKLRLRLSGSHLIQASIPKGPSGSAACPSYVAKRTIAVARKLRIQNHLQGGRRNLRLAEFSSNLKL